MKSVGMWMAILGIGSFVLNMMNREFILLSWIDNWGPQVGLGIRIAMIVIGAALFFLARSPEPETAE